jgi:endonuclease YncB( thermonuclease family)
MSWISSWATVVVMISISATAAQAQTVTKVLNGDTVLITGVGKIKLLGILSGDEPVLKLGQGTVPPAQPRTDPPGTRATPAVSGAYRVKPDRPSRAFLQQLVLGKVVRLEYDPLTRDESRNPRAYVFLADGTFVNAEMLRQGKARVDSSRPFAHEQEFMRLEKEAQNSGIGIWIQLPRR